MIAALHAFFDDRHVRLRVDGGIVDDFRERRLVDVVRATAGHERPARVEQFQRAQVDLLVAGRRLRDGGLVFGERRRIQHDCIEPLAEPFQAAQVVEDVPNPRVDRDAVPRGVRTHPRDRLFGNVDRDRFLCRPREP